MPKCTYTNEPPYSHSSIYSIKELKKIFNENLLNKKFVLTGKNRTDGSNFRKMICKILNVKYKKPKVKGLPKIYCELLDIKLIGKANTKISFNLQVWNRIPSSKKKIGLTKKNEPIYGDQIRYIFGYHDNTKEKITSIGIFTPSDIEKKLRKKTFSNTKTSKEQAIISKEFRENAKLLFNEGRALISEDNIDVSSLKKMEIRNNIQKHQFSFKKHPNSINHIYPIKKLCNLIIPDLYKFRKKQSQTKISGQNLEYFIIKSLGYKISKNHSLEGQFPDLRNQLLEIKIQESPTIDFGRYSPILVEEIDGLSGYNTEDIRYLILLIDEEGCPEGLACLSGKSMMENPLLSFVSQTNWKSQNSIPLDIFRKNEGSIIHF